MTVRELLRHIARAIVLAGGILYFLIDLIFFPSYALCDGD